MAEINILCVLSITRLTNSQRGAPWRWENILRKSANSRLREVCRDPAGIRFVSDETSNHRPWPQKIIPTSGGGGRCSCWCSRVPQRDAVGRRGPPGGDSDVRCGCRPPPGCMIGRGGRECETCGQPAMPLPCQPMGRWRATRRTRDACVGCAAAYAATC